MEKFTKILENSPVLENKYKLIKLINTGGNGAVFKAQNILTNDIIALKLLFSQKNKPSKEISAHFLAGAKLCLGLNHKYLVRTVDYGQDEVVGSYLVMEYLKGINLSEYLKKNNGISENKIIQIGNQISAVLKYLHDKNMLHGDIKPENVFLLNKKNNEIHIKLLDFLPKRRVADWQNQSTPGYLAPEILIGKIPGPELDLFALGVLLHELTFSKLPEFKNNKLILPSHKSNISEDQILFIHELLSFKIKKRFKIFNKFLKKYEESITEGDDSFLEQSSILIEPPEISHKLNKYKSLMVDENPLPHFLINKNLQIIFSNITAQHLLGRDHKNELFVTTPLALSAPILLNDIQDAFELVAINSREVKLSGNNTVVWTAPIIEDGFVICVQLIVISKMEC
jgi:serine/threonine protein kinase